MSLAPSARQAGTSPKFEVKSLYAIQNSSVEFREG
jgi:hypothetical protein